MYKVVVIVPNWNGADYIAACLDSLINQSLQPHIIVVDNGSVDNSAKILESKYPEVELIRHDTNMGYAGGVNPGFKKAIELGVKYVASFNNDAVADKTWLENLVNYLDQHEGIGIVTPKILNSNGQYIDSTGDYYTVWGLPYPRGRKDTEIDKYDKDTQIFGASGGASLYRVKMLEEVGLFDEDFFAYYEDVDLSFRAQLYGWKIAYVPKSIVFHQISKTSDTMKGFSSYQTMKNLPLLLLKNVPAKYLFRVGWRFTIAHILFFLRAISRGQGWMALKGDFKGTYLLLGAYNKRQIIQKAKTVSDEYIWEALVHDLPPNAKALRSLRAKWWRLRGRQ